MRGGFSLRGGGGGGVGGLWWLRVGEGEGGGLLRGGVHGGGALVRRRDERGGGVERGFGSVPVHSVFLLPSWDIRYFQYASSRAKYTHVVSRTFSI